ncbi:hypothetical protein I5481_23210 [Citrobacter freundii]|nr:hypothetical protein [Citrobacter freundii]
MKRMKKIANTIKKFNFFDPFPATDYYALIVHKSNNERLFDAIVELNEGSKKVLLQLNDDIKKSIGKDDIGDTERLLRIFLNEANDFRVKDSEWDELIAAKCERRNDRGRRIYRTLGRCQQHEEELELGGLQQHAHRVGG